MPDDTTPDLVKVIALKLAEWDGGPPDELWPCHVDPATEVLAVLAEHGWGDLAEAESLTTDVQLKLLEARDESDRWQRQYGEVVAELAEVTRERDEARAELDKAHYALGERMLELYGVTRVLEAARRSRDYLSRAYTSTQDLLAEVSDQSRREIDAMRPIVDAAQALDAVEANRTDASDNCSMWLTAHSDAVGAVLAAVERYEHPAVEVENGEAHEVRCGCALCYSLWVRGERTVPASPLSAPVEPVQGETAPEGGDESGLPPGVWEAAATAYGRNEGLHAALLAATPIIRAQGYTLGYQHGLADGGA
jgi:hypothetical protein